LIFKSLLTYRLSILFLDIWPDPLGPSLWLDGASLGSMFKLQWSRWYFLSWKSSHPIRLTTKRN
jgi:hypothetical protein